MKMTLPKTLQPTEGEEGVATPAFNDTDSLILANLEGDIKHSSTQLLKLRNELKQERFCKEWLTKEIHRYHRASEGLDSRSTGSEESELNPEEDLEALTVIKEELETPRASVEEDESKEDNCKKAQNVEEDDDDADEEELEDE